jgi:F-type H+-transporting ATPase subunit alpha
VSKQIAIIYAATQGWLDDVAVKDCRSFEAGLCKHLDLNGQDYTKALLEKQVLDEDVTEKLDQLLKSFKHQFIKEQEAK